MFFSAKRPADRWIPPEVEAALRESRDKFAQAFQASADAVTIADYPSGRITEVNDAYCRLFGLAREEAVGRSGRELGSWASMVDREHFMRQLEADGVVREMEATKVRADGKPLMCRITAFRLELGGRTCMMTRICDITEQRMAEKALRESEEKFSKAFRASPDLIAITTLNEGRLLDVNSAFTRTLGWSREEALGRTTVELGIWHGLADREKLRTSLLAGKVAHNLPVVFRDKSGKDHPCLYFGEPTEIGGKACLISIIRDLTEQQRLEEQLRQAHRLESIGLLAGGVAHDFNNVLSVIKGNTSLALERPDLSRELKDMLRQVQDAAEFAAALTRQLLVFSRRQVFQPGRVSPAEAVDQIVKLLQRTLGEHITLAVDLPPVLPDIRADGGMVEQVLLNLAVNARDAMPDGGDLGIGARVAEIDSDYVRRVPQAKPGSFVGLIVRDTGVGVPPEVLPRIFDPFFTTKAEGRGTGLGLATVYGIAQQHGGWIEVDSKVGHGTEFTVWFPVDSSPAVTREAPVARPAAGHETLLLVEDKEEVRAVLESIFARSGFHVRSAANGPEALALWARHRDEIALLFTDIVMPGGINGRELAERLRSDRPLLKVVFCSGYDANLLGDGALSAPGVRFLAKPFNVAQTTRLVRELLDEQPAA